VSELTELRECLLEILKALSEQPRRLELRLGEASIELDWPENGPGSAGAASGPAPVSRAGEPVPSARPAAAEAERGTADLICSPSVGTFYWSSEPGAAPFVSEGDLVRPGQQVAIVEAMKLMLPVEADRAGRIAKVLKANGEPVEYGEPLMELAPVAEAEGAR
jgi:acetyl-CoA carboxylase biotin carboxyl carrier protein